MHVGSFSLTYSRKLAENLGIRLKLRAAFPEWGLLVAVPSLPWKCPRLFRGRISSSQSSSAECLGLPVQASTERGLSVVQLGVAAAPWLLYKPLRFYGRVRVFR